MSNTNGLDIAVIGAPSTAADPRRGKSITGTLPRWGVLMLKLTRALYRNAE